MRPEDLFIIGLIIGGFLFHYLFKYLRRKKLNRKMTRARKAEGRALKLLEREGYEIIEVQKRVPFVTHVDGKPYKNSIQADYIVTRDGKTFVVEVKTGGEATQVTTSQTRRQLLEYYLVYRPDGIILLDMECEELREVKFEVDLPIATRKFSLVSYLLTFAAGGLLALILLKGGLF